MASIKGIPIIAGQMPGPKTSSVYFVNTQRFPIVDCNEKSGSIVAGHNKGECK